MPSSGFFTFETAAETMLAEFNSGLFAIKESGDWFEIVRRHLTEFRAMTSEG